jgi:DNA repair protein RecO (recombination protein O)
MPLITVESLVLQSFAYGETSKILRLLTATHGVLSAIARGALRPRSRFGGLLEPFSEGTATLYVKEGRDLQTLASFELTASHQTVARDLLRFGGASLLAEIVIRCGSEESHPGLFETVRTGLRRIRSVDEPTLESTLLAETWRLVGCLGFAPAFEHCVGCGRIVDAGEMTAFDFEAGGVRCETCAGTGTARALPAAARADLIRLCRGEAAPLARTAAHWRLIGRYLGHHVLEGARLNSLDFLAATLAARSCAG